MKPYIKKYFDFFDIGYYPDGSHDVIKCELCGKIAVDIMHIIPKSRGGKDVIKNLMAGCRSCHEENEGRNIEEMQGIHLRVIENKLKI